jgi:hypothetical protein
MAKQKDIQEKTIDCLALQMTKTHCKGVVYQLTELEAKEGVENKLFKYVNPIVTVEETTIKE